MTEKQKITALVLAGQRKNGDPVADAANVSLKAFARINGVAMIDYVLTALQKSGRIDHIIVTIPAAHDFKNEAPLLYDLIHSGYVSLLTPAAGPAASVRETLEHMDKGHDLLVTTADHPLLTETIVNDFLAKTAGLQDGIGVGVVPMTIVQSRFPESKRTRLRFKDGCYSGCNLFYLSGQEVTDAVSFWENLEQDRKKPLRMAAKIGPLTLIGYFLKLTTFQKTLNSIGKKGNTNIRAIYLDDPHAAIDVDTPQDLEFVHNLFAKKNIVKK